MGSTLSTEVMTFDRTGETFTFRGTGYINQLTDFKHRNGDFVTGFQFSQFFFSQSKLDQTATGFNTCFCKVPSFGFVDTVSFFLTKGNLNGGIAVSIFGFYLCNAVGRHIQNGYRNRNTLFVEHAGHTNFASNQT